MPLQAPALAAVQLPRGQPAGDMERTNQTEHTRTEKVMGEHGSRQCAEAWPPLLCPHRKIHTS